jgi:hypothetical protein
MHLCKTTASPCESQPPLAEFFDWPWSLRQEGDHGRQSSNCTHATNHCVSHCSNNVRAARAKTSAADPCFLPRRSSRAVAARMSTLPACSEAAPVNCKCFHLICGSALGVGVCFAHRTAGPIWSRRPDPKFCNPFHADLYFLLDRLRSRP